MGTRSDELKLSELGAWSIKTQTGISLFLGKDELKNRLERFVALEEYRRHGWESENGFECRC